MRRTVEILLATSLLVLLGLHAAGKARDGLLPEMLWACHVASVLVAAGVLARQPRPIAVGGLFHLGIGIPALALDVLATGVTTPTSVALHLLTPAAAAWSLRGAGLPRTAVRDAFLFYLLLQPVGWLAPEELNVNVAHRPWAHLPWVAGPWVSRAINAAGALLFLLGAAAAARPFLAPRSGGPAPATG